MPGAFTHLTLTNLALAENMLAKTQLSFHAQFAITENTPYIELGSISPQYPYFATNFFQDNVIWAEYMQLDKKTDVMIKKATELIRELENQHEKDKAFAWLCGFISNIVADAVIHPVLELKAGQYKDNQEEHNIYPKINLDEINLTEFLATDISKCSDSSDNKKLDPIIKNIWLQTLKEIRTDEYSSNMPSVDIWHQSFQKIVSLSEKENELHFGQSYLPQYSADINDLKTPNGTMDYDEIINIVKEKILQSWKVIDEAIFENKQDKLKYFSGWNIDNGRDINNKLIFWS